MEQLLDSLADRSSSDLSLDLATCPVLDAAAFERTLPTGVSLPPLRQPWAGELMGDLTSSLGRSAGLDLGVGNNPTVGCSGTWGSETTADGSQLDVLLTSNLRDTDPPEGSEPFGGGRLHTDCTEDTSCMAVWQSDPVGLTIDMSGTLPVSDAFDEWVTGLVPAILDGAANFDLDAVLPPPVTSSPPARTSAPTAVPAPVPAAGPDCESQLIAAITNYATGAASIDAVLAAVPPQVADDAARYAEDTRNWVATDPVAAASAAEEPYSLFGSGAVIGSLCAGA